MSLVAIAVGIIVCCVVFILQCCLSASSDADAQMERLLGGN